MAAYKNELQYLCPMGRRYLKIKNGNAYLCSGIGPTAASFGLTHFLEDYRPKLIISLGTAGIINSKKNKIGDIVCANSVSCHTKTPHHLSSMTYKPITLNTPKALGLYLKGSLGINCVRAYGSQDITTSLKGCKQLEVQGYAIENMEAYAHAFVAQKFKIPHVALYGLTNIVGPKAHNQWQYNEAMVVKKLNKLVERLVAKTAPLTCQPFF